MKTTTRKIRGAPTAQIIDFIAALRGHRPKARRFEDNPGGWAERILRRAKELAARQRDS